MTYFILKGFHWALPIIPKVWWRPSETEYEIKFTDSCRYDIGYPDQGDVNKLLGSACIRGWFSLGKWWQFWEWHPKDVARFGWSYNLSSKMIDIYAYGYVNGSRFINFLTSVNINESILLTLAVGNYTYYFKAGQAEYVALMGRGTKRKWRYRVGVYFGGNKVAPHTIKIIAHERN